MSDFSKAKVGDKVYSLLYGYGTIDYIDTSYTALYPLKIIFNTQPNKFGFNYEGKCFPDQVIKDLYWDKPTIIEPEAPKRMIKKSITAYVNITKSGAIYTHSCLKNAQLNANNIVRYDAIAVPLLVEYEVEE